MDNDEIVTSIEKKRKRLIFRADHRGIKEMDLLLGSFAKQHVPGMSEGELALFDALLEENDPDLYNWVTGKEETPANIASPVFDKLREHKFGEISVALEDSIDF